MLKSWFSEILSASLPFITLGLLGDTVVLYISVTVGALALVGLCVAMVMKDKMPSCNSLGIQPPDFSLPYAIALSAAILNNNGIDTAPGYWCAALLFIIILTGKLIIAKRRI